MKTASRLLSTAAAANVDIAWIETSIDAGFTLIRQRRADAGLGWLTSACEALPAPLDLMRLGEFEPEVWIPSSHGRAHSGTISLDELARMNVIQGPRRASAGIYDAWLAVLRTEDAGLEFTDPPFRNSLPMTLAFAATGTRLTAVLTGPRYVIEPRSTPAQPHRPANPYDMVPVRLQQHPLVASAGLVWSGDLPRQLQQVLFDAADGSPF